MKKILLITTVFCFTVISLYSQNDIDAFRFSQVNWQGTARFMGAGGAFGAVGAEYSALNVNPATIGIYKRNEISFTPIMVSIFNSQSDYSGDNNRYLASNYSLPNFGMIGVISTSSGKWKGVQLGFGYNRINDFNNAFRIEGRNNGSSMADIFVRNANGTHYENLIADQYLAWNTFVIDTLPNTANQYYSPFSNADLLQKKYTRTSGAINEMNFSIGGNYDDKLYIGATIGVPFLNYREESEYSETDDENRIGGVESFIMRDNLRVRGTGVNLKLGLIYQPVEYFRFGLAFHTPTYYGNLKHTRVRDMIAYFDDATRTDRFEYENYNTYKLVTPLRAVGSVAFLIQKRAFVSVDYEFSHYGMASLYGRNYSYTEENRNIQDKYGPSHTIRIGSEVFLSNQFLFRLGYNFMSNPYSRNVDNNSSAHLVSAGIGLRTNHFFLDLAYNIQLSKERYWMYDPAYVSPADNHYTTHRIAATLGFKF